MSPTSHIRAFVHLHLATSSFPRLYDGSGAVCLLVMVGGSDQTHPGHIKVTDFFPYSRTESGSGWTSPPEAGLGGLASPGGRAV